MAVAYSVEWHQIMAAGITKLGLLIGSELRVVGEEIFVAGKDPGEEKS